LLALLAIFAKKFWFVIIIPFVFVWKWIKKTFMGPAERGEINEAGDK
jgi:hypothetical protein